ncbi:transposon-transfer assisting family protein [Acetoanaerobium noterae]|uniref:transposon-transfer assisting family protein n=1 Tax=Acetoanaerobium noterae TaxID=745369 RepID=UPI003316E54B
MSQFTVDEKNLICIYHTGTRADLITELSEMQKHLEQDEIELLELTNTVIDKLNEISDNDFENFVIELVTDFEEPEFQ